MFVNYWVELMTEEQLQSGWGVANSLMMFDLYTEQIRQEDIIQILANAPKGA